MKKIILLATLFYTSFLFCNNSDAQVYDPVKRDSIIEVLKKYNLRKKELMLAEIIPADTIKADLLWEFLVSADYFNNQKEWTQRLAELKKISTAINYKKGIANALTGEGSMMALNQDFKNALDLHKKALSIRESINDLWGIRWGYFNIANCYGQQGISKDAMYWYLKGLKQAESAKDSMLVYYIYSGLSTIYELQGQLKEAEKAATKAAHYSYNPNNKYNYGMALAVCAYYSSMTGELSKADSVLNILQPICKSLNSLFHYSYYYNVKAAVEEAKGDYGKAILNYLKSNEMEDSMKTEINKPYTLTTLSGVVLKADKHQLAIAGISESQKYDAAIRFAQLSLDISITANQMDLTADNYKYMSEAYEKKGDLMQAYNYYKMSMPLKDSIYSIENTKTINEWRMQYETEKKEQQIALLSKGSQLQQSEIEKQKTTRNAFIGGSFLVLLLAGVSYNRYRVKQKANIEIESTLKRLNETQQQIVQHGKLSALGKMTSDVARQIKTPLKAVNEFVYAGENLIQLYEVATTDEMRNEIAAQLKTNLQSINRNGTQADEMVKEVLANSRK